MTNMQQSLDALQNTINNVLVDVGKALSKSKRDGRTASQPYPRVHTGIPKLEDAYHITLDNIEEEIVRAKAVLLRDLEHLQAKRAAAEPKPLAVLNSEKPPETLSTDMPSVPISVMNSRKESSVGQFGGDGSSETTLDQLQKSISDVQEIVKSSNITAKESPSAKEMGNSSNPTPSNRILPNESLFQSPSDSKDQVEKQSADEARKLESGIKEETVKDDNEKGMELSRPNNDDTTMNVQANSTDVDSLFDGNNSNSNSNQNDNIDFADIDFTAGDDFTFPENTTAQNNSDLDSLMPGIESYAAVNQSDEFSMLDFPNNTDGAKDSGNANADTTIDELFDFPEDNNAGSGNMEGNNSNNNDLGISAESNFDDLLDDMDFGDADDGTGAQAMEHGEFDEAFFGLSG